MRPYGIKQHLRPKSGPQRTTTHNLSGILPSSYVVHTLYFVFVFFSFFLLVLFGLKIYLLCSTRYGRHGMPQLLVKLFAALRNGTPLHTGTAVHALFWGRYLFVVFRRDAYWRALGTRATTAVDVRQTSYWLIDIVRDHHYLLDNQPSTKEGSFHPFRPTAVEIFAGYSCIWYVVLWCAIMWSCYIPPHIFCTPQGWILLIANK